MHDINDSSSAAALSVFYIYSKDMSHVVATAL